MINLRLVENVEVDGIDTFDYPDFVDAFIVYAEYDGKEMTEEQIEELNENSEFVQECVSDYLF